MNNMSGNCSDIIERMKWAAGLKNDTAVAGKLGVTPQAISNCRKKGNIPPDHVVRFAELFGLSVDWLLTGRGRMERDWGVEAGGEGREGEEGGARRPWRPGGLGPQTPLGVAAYGITGGEWARGVPSISALSPDEIICVGRVLKILRGSNRSNVEALKHFVNSLMKST